MSRAEETWVASGRPFGLTKCDSRRPSVAAVAFMSSAKAGTEPDTPSATVTAMSLADFTISMRRALISVTWVPSWNPIFEGGCERA